MRLDRGMTIGERLSFDNEVELYENALARANVVCFEQFDLCPRYDATKCTRVFLRLDFSTVRLSGSSIAKAADATTPPDATSSLLTLPQTLLTLPQTVVVNANDDGQGGTVGGIVDANGDGQVGTVGGTVNANDDGQGGTVGGIVEANGDGGDDQVAGTVGAVGGIVDGGIVDVNGDGGDDLGAGTVDKAQAKVRAAAKSKPQAKAQGKASARTESGTKKVAEYDDDDASESSSEASCVSSLHLDDDDAEDHSAGEPEEDDGPAKPANPHHPVWTKDWHIHPPTMDMWVEEFESRMGRPFVTQHMAAIQATYKACYFNDPYFLGFGDRPLSCFIFPHHDGYKVSSVEWRRWFVDAA